MQQFQLQWLINEDGKLVKQFLQEQKISKTALTDIKFNGGDILVNGEHVTVLHRLRIGEVLTVIFPKEEKSEQLVPQSLELSIVYEDEFLMVVNKPPFMNTIPSREHPTGSLANGILGYFEEKQIDATVHIVTRLDRDTSGLVLIAKHRHIHHLFSLMQRNNEIQRKYDAIVQGFLLPKKGTINKPIDRKPDSIIERWVTEGGQQAITHYEVIKEYNSYSHIRLKLETGRTHQIRVHMSYHGHPLVGDSLYGGSKEDFLRQALHCSYLQFLHPISKELLTFELPLYEDLLNLV